MTKTSLILLLLIFLSEISFSQDSIYGKLYGGKAIAKYIKVSSPTKNTTTFSDENGNFSLKATVGDSIIFSSSFYEEKLIVVNKIHFSEVFVVELKDKINELDEVILTNNFRRKEFNLEEFNYRLNIQIKNDIRRNPQKYRRPPSPRGGVNLREIVHLTKKLFKKNKKYNKPIFSSSKPDYEPNKHIKENLNLSDSLVIKDSRNPLLKVWFLLILLRSSCGF